MENKKSKPSKPLFLTDAQLRAEIEKCEYCEEKPCKEACPADCSPADFIMAVSVGGRSDYRRSAAHIMGSNPLGGVCGAVCPDYHCVEACVRRTFDHVVNIPAVQATIIQKAKELGVLPRFNPVAPDGRKIAVIGAGPAGLGATAVLAREGGEVTIYEKEGQPGGMNRLIPQFRLNRGVLKTDIDFLVKLGRIRFRYNQVVKQPHSLLQDGFNAVIVASGLDEPLRIGFKGEEHAISWVEVLKQPRQVEYKGKAVAIIGGGAIAVDCAVMARKKGAESVALICLEKLDEMPLTSAERRSILEAGVDVVGRTRVIQLEYQKGEIKGITTLGVKLPKRTKFHPGKVREDPEAKPYFRPFDQVIVAIGGRSSGMRSRHKGVFYAGDMVNGPTSVVEAVAAGKNAAVEALAFLKSEKSPVIAKKTKSRVTLTGADQLPVSLESDFFGRLILSPFLLSAGPTTDGYEQMKQAYQAGWPGGVMKTAFGNVPIHIPSEYMFRFSSSTYGNCDNVSGHPLDRVYREVEKLVREFPDHLTLASTGGPVTGDDDADMKAWQSNMMKLEDAGVMGIEFSLSCPQGGDGTRGDIVSQDPELTAKIVEWIMTVSNPQIPKLFKLTGAVTAIKPIVDAIKEVFKRYPGKKAGITLANSFPGLAFRPRDNPDWDEGVVIGLSGEGIIPISNLTLAKVSDMGIVVSGNGGPMDYRSAAGFLALGAQTVQFCTLVMKHGYGIIGELHSGLSYLLDDLGHRSAGDLIGSALPHPITDFGDLPDRKKISQVQPELCQHCGNCQRCPYLAISLDEQKIPVTDPAHCIGCSICALKCFSGALYMRERSKEEISALSEA
jgi:NADPH-dependent glutamate synthase beta subunit-like oxidoreductase/dihydroorotate dehydrogenase/Pyruvate/2-oxoacid:ferredoxin oxidoreductase delta subunit